MQFCCQFLSKWNLVCCGKSTCQTVSSSSRYGPLCSIDHLVGRGNVARRVGFRRRSGHVADGHLSCLARWSHVHLVLVVHNRFVAVFALVLELFGLLGGDPRRGLDLLGHFSEDHGKTSRSSHTSKEVDARWNTRATKHIGEEYLGNTREEKRAGEREREEQEYLDRLPVQSLRANCSSTYLDDHTAWSQRNPNQQRGLGRIKHKAFWCCR